MKKRIITSLIAGAMLFTSLPAMAENEVNNKVTVTYNGEEMSFDTEPVIENGYTLVPLRKIFETMGAEVAWDNDTATVTAVKGGTEISLTIGDRFMYINGEKKDIPIEAKLVSDRTYVPLRMIGESFGAKVGWNEASRTVSINTTMNDSFTFKLMQTMNQDENYMISPLSVKLALGMLANGVTGDTQEEILKTAGFVTVNDYNEFALNLLSNHSENTVDENTAEIDTVPKTIFNIADSIWINRDYFLSPDIDFSDSFKDVTKKYYNAQSGSVGNDDAVETINSWVKNNTNNKIDSVLSDADFGAVLINAVYMKSDWINKFEESDTDEGDFILGDGTSVKKDFMHQTAHLGYYSDDNSQILSMPYYDNISMYAVIGDYSQFDSEKNMTEYKKVNVTMPKFKTETSVSLKKSLEQTGITQAFKSSKDFMGILNSDEELLVDDILHKTYINVDEKGTEAAAVTSVMMTGSAMPVEEEIVDFTADKPFTYFICDDITGEIIFAGQVVK